MPAPKRPRRLRKYTSPALLILDEIGYLPCSRQSADLLYNITAAETLGFGEPLAWLRSEGSGQASRVILALTD